MMDNDEQIVKNLMQTTREELQELVVKRVELEKQVDESYAKIEQLQQNISEKLEEIHHFRDQESSLESKLLLLQKEAFLDKIQPQKLKKIITESQVFKNVVQKGKDIRQVLDGSIMDEDWVDERYEAYRKLCIQNGTELKTKEEFKEFAMNVQKQENAEALPLPDLFAFAKRKITKAGTLVKDFLNPILDEKETTQEQKVQEDVVVKKTEVPLTVQKNGDGAKVTPKENKKEEVVKAKKEVVVPIQVEDVQPSTPTVVEVVKSPVVVEQVNREEHNEEEVNLPVQTKDELFKKWVKNKKISKKSLTNKTQKELHEIYIAYLMTQQVDLADKKLIYPYLGGSFGKALKNHFGE